MIKRASSALVVAAFMIAGMTAPASAGPTYTFGVHMGSGCVDGAGPADEPVTAVLKDGSHILDTQSTSAASNGIWAVCFTMPVHAGLTLVAKNGPSRRAMRIPAFTVRGDRVSNVVSGLAPATMHVDIEITQCEISSCTIPPPFHAVADAQGHYARNVNGGPHPLDLKGQATMVATFQTVDGDRFQVVRDTPWFIASLPNQVVLQCGQAGTTVVFALRKGDGTLRSSASHAIVDRCSPMDFRFRHSGSPVAIHPGNVITGSFASDARMTWPHMAATGDTSTNVVSGHCFRDAGFQITMSRNGGGSFGWSDATDSSGDFAKALGVYWTLMSGDSLTLVCQDHAGDQATFESVVP